MTFAVVRAARSDASHYARAVAQRAVQQGLNGSFVYTLSDSNKVSARPVSATAWQGNQWIIEDGQGKRTTISVANLETEIEADPKLFVVKIAKRKSNK